MYILFILYFLTNFNYIIQSNLLNTYIRKKLIIFMKGSIAQMKSQWSFKSDPTFTQESCLIFERIHNINLNKFIQYLYCISHISHTPCP